MEHYASTHYDKFFIHLKERRSGTQEKMYNDAIELEHNLQAVTKPLRKTKDDDVKSSLHNIFHRVEPQVCKQQLEEENIFTARHMFHFFLENDHMQNFSAQTMSMQPRVVRQVRSHFQNPLVQSRNLIQPNIPSTQGVNITPRNAHKQFVEDDHMDDFDIFFFGDDFEGEGQVLISTNIEDISLNKSIFSEHTPSVTSTSDKS